MAKSDLIYLAKLNLMKKADYINELIELTRSQAKKLTVKQLRQLLARHQCTTQN